MLIIGVLGIALCLLSVILLGFDITAWISSGFILSGTFKLTKILEVMHKWTPDWWAQTVNYLNDGPLSLQKTVIDICVNLPAAFVGLIFGFALVLIGFRVRRQHID